MTIHRASRLDYLARPLGQMLAAHPPGVFDIETIAVPARGVQRWLEQMLSHYLGTSVGQDGIAAGFDFRATLSLIDLFGREDLDPWHPNQVAWRILEVVDDHASDEWLAPLARHIGVGEDRDRSHRRYAVAHRIANLFSSYSTGRPALVRDWLNGNASDGIGGELATDLTWQMHLISHVAERIGTPPPAMRVEDVIAQAQRAKLGRLQIFGHTRLSHTDTQILSALAANTDVHLWLPHPSPALWEELAPLLAQGEPGIARSMDHTGDLAGNSLLRTLGRETRELQRTLVPLGTMANATASLVEPEEGAPSTLLEHVQVSVRSNSEPDSAPDDRSIQVHACHGPSRQVEVLRELLTGLFEDDPSLEPRDVIIVCPDVEAYAPLFDAAFGPQPENPAHPGHTFRLAVADRSGAAVNPLLDLARTLIDLKRLRASELIDLMHRDEVRRRFGFTDADLETLTTWVHDSSMRWGLNTQARARFKVGINQNTISAGLSRLLVGVTMAEDGHDLAGVLPLDDVGSTAIPLAGTFAELLSRLETALDHLDSAATVAEWVAALDEAASSLAEPEHTWQSSAFARDLTRIALGGEAPASRSDMRRILDNLAHPRPSSANLRTGALTVASLVPMRSVPHRVVCLVGMDDGAFPRGTRMDGDDALARQPLAGERDPRIEDRQLFLDALMSATDTFIVTYTGADELRGDKRHPAVPVSELIDAVATATHTAPADIVTHHPLHPFDSRYFPARGSESSGLASFDGAAAEGARITAAGLQQPKPPLLDEPLPTLEETDVALADVHSFFGDPVKVFIRDRLGVSIADSFEPVDDAIPISAGGLTGWAIGNRLLTRVEEEGLEPGLVKAERLRGNLPPGALGGRELQQIGGRVEALTAAADRYRSGDPVAVDVDIDLAGVRLAGRIGNVYSGRIVHVSYSSLGVKHRFAAWIDLLALTVVDPETEWEATVIGRHRDGAKISHLRAVAPEFAQEYLIELLDIRARGMCEPLPIPPKTAAAWATQVYAMSGQETPARRKAVFDAANTEWKATYWRRGEQEDPYQQLAWGSAVTLDDLLAHKPASDEAWNPETTRLGQYALRLWEPMLRHERL